MPNEEKGTATIVIGVVEILKMIVQLYAAFAEQQKLSQEEAQALFNEMYPKFMAETSKPVEPPAPSS